MRNYPICIALLLLILAVGITGCNKADSTSQASAAAPEPTSAAVKSAPLPEEGAEEKAIERTSAKSEQSAAGDDFQATSQRVTNPGRSPASVFQEDEDRKVRAEDSRQERAESQRRIESERVAREVERRLESTARSEKIRNSERAKAEPQGKAPPTRTEQGAKEGSGSEKTADKIKIVRLFYATDRKPTGATEAIKFFGSERSDRTNAIHYGVCHVTLPPDHQFGRLEEYSLLRFETKNVPEKHVTLNNLRPMAKEKFFQEVKDSIGKTKEKEIFVFIHGFNVTWEESATRCGQVAYDLGIDQDRGIPFLFSWPSKGNFIQYMADDTNGRVAHSDFRHVLEELASSSGARHINILAHSMGNQLMCEALNGIGNALGAKPLFNQVVMAAPDVDIDDLSIKSTNMVKVAKHFTIYSCKKDRPLRISRWFRGDNCRVGSFAVIDGFDTIDGTEVEIEGLLHHNMGDVPTILRDVKKLLRYGCSVIDRCCCCFQRVDEPAARYWAFRAATGGCTHREKCPSL